MVLCRNVTQVSTKVDDNAVRSPDVLSRSRKGKLESSPLCMKSVIMNLELMRRNYFLVDFPSSVVSSEKARKTEEEIASE